MFGMDLFTQSYLIDLNRLIKEESQNYIYIALEKSLFERIQFFTNFYKRFPAKFNGKFELLADSTLVILPPLLNKLALEGRQLL